MLGPLWRRWTRGRDRSDGRIPPTQWESAPLDARKRSFGINLGSSRDPAVPEAGEPRGTRGRSRYRPRMAGMRLRVTLLGVALAFTLSSPETAWAQHAAATPPLASGRGLTDSDGIQSADVLARVELLRSNVELLRQFMGRPAPPTPLLRVSSARPLEVYSQATNLERRANRLSFEQVRVIRPESPPTRREPRPADVFAVVDSAFEAVLLAARKMDIEPDLVETAAPLSTSPSDVFNATIEAAAEIDQLLELRTSPSDVFQLVTAGVHTASALHVTIPGRRSLPSEPEFEPNKMPADVFMRLQRCLHLVHEIARAKGMQMLVLEVAAESQDRVAPTDVSDLASLVAEELLDLHRMFPDARKPVRAYYPGRRFPAHVYQRAGLLERLLEDLAAAYAGDGSG